MRHNEDVMSAWGGICDVSHQIGEKVYSVIYVKVLFNFVNAF